MLHQRRQVGLTRCTRGRRIVAAEPAPNQATFGRNYDGSSDGQESGTVWRWSGRWRLGSAGRRQPRRPCAPRPPSASWSTATPAWRSTASIRSPISPSGKPVAGPGRLRTSPCGRDLALRQRGQPRGLRRRPGGLYAALRRLRSGRHRARRRDARISRRFGSCTTSGSISSIRPMRGQPSWPIRPR